MMIKEKIKKLTEFNQDNRDSWVESQADLLPEGSKLLDVGAGFGRYKKLFDHCEYKAQDFCDYHGEEWHYGKIDYVSDITSIPVEDASFDAIINTEVLEHVPEPIKAIEEFSRILKEGGTLLITAPLGCGLHQKPHIYYGGYTPYWYERFLGQYGLKVKEITPNGGFFLSYAQETARIMHYLFPKRKGLLTRTLIFPFKAFAGLFLMVLIPMVCHWLDQKYPDHDFTVGYFVRAVKTKVDSK